MSDYPYSEPAVLIADESEPDRALAPTGARLLSPTFRIGVALVLFMCTFMVARRGIASWYSRQTTPSGLQKAIAYDPGNAEYYAQLGLYHLRSFDEYSPEKAVEYFRAATRLSPFQARYWAGLAEAYEDAGQKEEARRAYETARQRFPNSPDMNWRVGNFLVRDGKLEPALEIFRKSLLGDPEIRRPAFEMVWRAGADASTILDKMVPARSDLLIEYIYYLVETNRFDEASKVWQHLLALGLPFEPQTAFPYLDGLIRQGRIEELTRAWAALVERQPPRLRRQKYESNLITNGDFESEILNGGLDWRVIVADGVVVRVDPLTHFDGTHSLRIQFTGHHNIDYGNVYQFVPVQPNRVYRFTGYLRAQGITTDSGPRFQIADAYDGGQLLSTESFVGDSNWSPQVLEFKTSPTTKLLVVRIARPPSRKLDHQLLGTVWIDRVSLTPAE